MEDCACCGSLVVVTEFTVTDRHGVYCDTSCQLRLEHSLEMEGMCES